MSILYNIRQKGRVVILMIVLLFFVIFSSYTYNYNISKMGDLSSEMYSDRLIAQDYIYKFQKILYERKFKIVTRNAIDTNNAFRHYRTDIITHLNNYEKTKLTKKEKIQFQEFKTNILFLLNLEYKYLVSNKDLKDTILEQQNESVNLCISQLDKLAEIQISSGKQLSEASEKIVAFSSILNQFDWAIIIIIGLIIQVIIFTSKSTVPKEVQNQFLN